MKATPKPLRILVTGAAGMLGSSLVPALANHGHTPIATDIAWSSTSPIPSTAYLDVRTHYLHSLTYRIINLDLDLIIHLAALTNLEECEQYPTLAFDTNVTGTFNMASLAHSLNIPFIYISTAGVFDGNKPSHGSYEESDTPNPINTYGQTKLLGEHVVRTLLPKSHYIIRAGWMVGGGTIDHKFVHHITEQLRNPSQHPIIYALTDKYGTPTYAPDFSEALCDLLALDWPDMHWITDRTFHLTNSASGPVSRYDVAYHIVRLLRHLNPKLSHIQVQPVTGDYFDKDFPVPRSNNEQLYNTYLPSMRPWQEALTEYLTTHSHFIDLRQSDTPYLIRKANT